MLGSPSWCSKPEQLMPDASGADMAIIGKRAYEQGDLLSCITWLDNASPKLINSSVERVDVLDHLSYAHYKTGNVAKALDNAIILLELDPLNGKQLQFTTAYMVIQPSRFSRCSPRSRQRGVLPAPARTLGQHHRHHPDPQLQC